jgi:hypothetical protein
MESLSTFKLNSLWMRATMVPLGATTEDDLTAIYQKFTNAVDPKPWLASRGPGGQARPLQFDDRVEWRVPGSSSFRVFQFGSGLNPTSMNCHLVAVVG